MKTALIGFGVIGKIHAVLARESGNELCICDIAPAARDCARELYRDASIYDDYRLMIEKERPDVVHICTPHYLHAEMSVYALDRGCNVLSEKPMCIREEEITEIVAAVARSGKLYGVCQQNRYTPCVRFVKEYLRGKTLTGAYASVVWNRDAAYYASGAWRGKRETEGGGVLINQALHTLDLVQSLTGMPRYVTAGTGNFHLKDKIEVEDTAALLLEGGACPVTFYATTAAGADFPVQISLRADGKNVDVRPTEALEDGRIIFSEHTQKLYAKDCYGDGHARLIAEFYRCVRTGERFSPDAEEAAKVVRIILAAYKSGGERVKL